MSRFTDIVRSLRAARVQLLEENRAKRSHRAKGGSRKKAPRKLTFASPELEAIFNGMPEECKALIRGDK